MAAPNANITTLAARSRATHRVMPRGSAAAGRRHRRRGPGGALGQQLRRESLPLRDPLDFDGDRIDAGLEAAQAVLDPGEVRWVHRIASVEPSRENPNQGKPED